MNPYTDLIASYEMRRGASESLGYQLEACLLRGPSRGFFSKLENPRYWMRELTFLVLEFLLLQSYTDAVTRDEIREMLEVLSLELPWIDPLTSAELDELTSYLLVDILRNGGQPAKHIPHPLSAPTTEESVLLLKQTWKKADNQPAYLLTEEGLQFLYRKKEVDMYLRTSFTAMMTLEAIEKGNFDVALRNTNELEGLLRTFLYVTMPTFETQLVEAFEHIGPMKRRVLDEGYQNLKKTNQKVIEIKEVVRGKKLELENDGLKGTLLLQSRAFQENSQFLLLLEEKVTTLLHLFGDTLTGLQQLGLKYEAALRNYEPCLATRYVDIRQEVYPALAVSELDQASLVLRSWTSLLETPAEPKIYTLERLMQPMTFKDPDKKEETVILDPIDLDELVAQQEAEEASRLKAIYQTQADFIYGLWHFMARADASQPIYLSDYTNALRATDLDAYATLLSLSGSGDFHTFILYDCFNQTGAKIPTPSEPILPNVSLLTEGLATHLLADRRFDAYRGSRLVASKLLPTDKAPLLVEKALMNFRLTLHDLPRP